MAEYKLELRGVCKSFPGVKALDNVQLSLRPGTVHALMGENGAGKSTLMKCLFGIYKMDAGEIYLDGEKISTRKKRVFAPGEMEEILLKKQDVFDKKNAQKEHTLVIKMEEEG